MPLTAKDKKEFQQLRQQLQPFLSSNKIQLLQRIQGEIGADLNSGSKPHRKLTKEQDHLQRVQKFL